MSVTVLADTRTFSRYDPEYAKAYREKQRAKRDAQRADGKVVAPPTPKTAPPPKVTQKTPVADAAVKLDRGAPLPAACTCATPPPAAADITRLPEGTWVDPSKQSNVRFSPDYALPQFLAKDLEKIGITDLKIQRRLTRLNRLFAERYGKRLSKVEDSRRLPSSVTKGFSADRVNAYIRNDDILGLNPKRMVDSIMARDTKSGWLVPGSGNIEGTLVHEYGHVFLQGLTRPKNVTLLQLLDRQRAARYAAERAARDAGAPPGPLGSTVSKYAQTDAEEAEAELWTFYHMGGSARPTWVIKWGEELHRSFGLDPTPMCVDLGVCPELMAASV
jgi:hypothetical protein